MEDETPAIEAARRTCFFAQSAFWRGNGRRLGNAARIAPSLFRPGDERILREGQSCEQRPAGRLRRSGAPAEAMAGRGRAFAAGLLQAREWPQTWRRGAWRQGLRRRCFDRAMSASCGKTSPANSVRQGSRGGRARRQSRWPGARFCGGSASGAGMAADLAMRQGLRRFFALAIEASRRKFSILNAAASIRRGRHEAQCGFFAMRAALGLTFLWKDAWPFACAIAGLV